MDTVLDRQHIGANNPPTDEQLLRATLTEKHETLFNRANDLQAAIARLPAVTDDETVGKVGDFVKMVTDCRKALETTREGEKAPFLAAGRIVDGLFIAYRDALDKVKDTAQRPVTAYLQAKAAEERRKRDEEARRQQEEAARLAQTATSAAEADLAANLSEQAEKTAASANAKPAELARTRSELGAVATLRTVRAFEVVDLNQLDLNLLRPYLNRDEIDKAIRAALKAKIEFATPALRYFDASTAAIR